MYTDILVQELHVRQLEQERIKDAARQDMFRLARASQPGLPIRMLSTIGTMLIAAGEILRGYPANLDSERSIRTDTPGYHALHLEQKSLSHSKT